MWHYESNLNWTSQKDSPESFHKGDAKSLRWICIVSLNRSYKRGGKKQKNKQKQTNKKPTARKQTVLSIGKVEQTQWNSVLSLRNTGGTTEDRMWTPPWEQDFEMSGKVDNLKPHGG